MLRQSMYVNVSCSGSGSVGKLSNSHMYLGRTVLQLPGACWHTLSHCPTHKTVTLSYCSDTVTDCCSAQAAPQQDL